MLSSIDWQLLRVVTDLLILVFSLRITRSHLARLSQQVHVTQLGIANEHSFSLATKTPCTVTNIRLGVQLSCNTDDNARALAYITLEIQGAFEILLIAVPHPLTHAINDLVDEVHITAKVGDTAILLVDTRKGREHFIWPHGLMYFDAYVRCDGAKRRFALNLHSPWAAGALYEEGKWFPVLDEARSIQHLYAPSIMRMEIDIDYAHGRFLPNLSESFPQPEAIVGGQLRWISERDRRPHSTVLATFVNENEQQKASIEVFHAGVVFAIGASIVVATAMDALWSFLGILGK